MAADLHLHTTASDGSWTPEELVRVANEVGLNIIAITDHDTIAGIKPAQDYNKTDLKIIPGIELSTEQAGHEIHILGYWVDLENDLLNQTLTNLQLDRVKRAKAMVQKLQKLGFDLDFDYLQEIAGSATIGRLHLAHALLKRNFITNINEGFSKYLNPGAPAYVSRNKLSPKQAIELILAAGGLPVLAHPGLIGNDKLIPDLVTAGLVGLEIDHPSHSEDQIIHYTAIAKAFGLQPTGGSDCHGPEGKDQVYIGTIQIPNYWVERLKAFLPEV